MHGLYAETPFCIFIWHGNKNNSPISTEHIAGRVLIKGLFQHMTWLHWMLVFYIDLPNAPVKLQHWVSHKYIYLSVFTLLYIFATAEYRRHCLQKLLGSLKSKTLILKVKSLWNISLVLALSWKVFSSLRGRVKHLERGISIGVFFQGGEMGVWQSFKDARAWTSLPHRAVALTKKTCPSIKRIWKGRCFKLGHVIQRPEILNPVLQLSPPWAESCFMFHQDSAR